MTTKTKKIPTPLISIKVPQDWYEVIKDAAKKNHRKISQQWIFYVELGMKTEYEFLKAQAQLSLEAK